MRDQRPIDLYFGLPRRAPGAGLGSSRRAQEPAAPLPGGGDPAWRELMARVEQLHGGVGDVVVDAYSLGVAVGVRRGQAAAGQFAAALDQIREARAHSCDRSCAEGGCDFDLGGFVERVDAVLALADRCDLASGGANTAVQAHSCTGFHGPDGPRHGYVDGKCGDYCNNLACPAGLTHEVCEPSCDDGAPT